MRTAQGGAAGAKRSLLFQTGMCGSMSRATSIQAGVHETGYGRIAADHEVRKVRDESIARHMDLPQVGVAVLSDIDRHLTHGTLGDDLEGRGIVGLIRCQEIACTIDAEIENAHRSIAVVLDMIAEPEALRRSGRLEPLHFALPPPNRLVRALSPVVGSLSQAPDVENDG